MKRLVWACALVTVTVVTASQFSLSQAPASGMSFFITSAGPGDGANLGGLTGADAYCQKLAAAAGGGRTWRAYLSTSASGNQPAVNARGAAASGPGMESHWERGWKPALLSV